jgi:hypothetical protein
VLGSKATREEIRSGKPEVECWRLVWFALATSKQAFILCLVFHNGLSTGDKLLSWSYRGEVQCVFCRIDHLFFECGF